MADMNFGVNILPDVDSSKNLGSSTKKWNTLYTNTLNEKAILNYETMTMAQYEALTTAQKNDGTVRFITDISSYPYPDAGGVGF